MQTKGNSVTNWAESDPPSAGEYMSSTIPTNVSAEPRSETMDLEDPSDYDGTIAKDTSAVADTEDFVGFSIGQEQLRMQSSETPAFEKAAALDKSKAYFDLEPEDADVDEGETYPGTNTALQSLDERVTGVPEYQPLPSRKLPEDPSPLSTSRSILKDGLGTRTRRSSSGSTGMVDTLRRFLPDLASLSFSNAPGLPVFGFGSKSRGSSQVNRPKRSSTLFSRGNLPWTSSSQSPERAVTTTETTNFRPKEDEPVSASPFAGNNNLDIRGARSGLGSGPYVSNTLSRNTMRDRRLLRRVTSESSLFMRADLERTTTQDDAEKWANVSEQINSRFKAITDSLQDSAITRMPKMPSVSLAFRSGLQRSNSDATRLNTDRNVAMAQLDATMTESESRFASRSTKQTKHAHPILKQAVSDLTGDVVVLGGYRGSILRSATPPNKQLWVPVKVGMNLRRVDLEVGLHPEDEERMTDRIVPSGVLSHIGPVDICRRLLRHLKKSSRARPDELRVHNYGYDWRLSPHLLSRQLIGFLESLDCNRPYVTGSNRGAVVIAHSLGGLITRHAVNQRPDLFAGIIYAGVPQHCINILGPLRNGDDVLLSSRVLTAQVNFTLRTSYALLPESGRCFINKTTGERYDIDFFDVRTWEEHCLSPCVSSSTPAPRPEYRKSILDTLSDSLPSLPLTNKRSSIIRRENSPAQEAHPSLEDVKDCAKDSANNTAQRAEEAFPVANAQPLEPSMGSPPPAGNRESIATACTIPRAEALEYLERTLKSVRQFKHELAFNPSHQAADAYPPIAVLYSSSVPTVFGARVDSREAIKRSDAYDNLAFAAGDGIVLSKSARPPEGYKVVRGGLVRSDRGHIGLLGDLEAVGKCLRAIGEARRRGVGTGIFAKKGDEPPS